MELIEVAFYQDQCGSAILKGTAKVNIVSGDQADFEFIDMPFMDIDADRLGQFLRICGI